MKSLWMKAIQGEMKQLENQPGNETYGGVAVSVFFEGGGNENNPHHQYTFNTLDVSDSDILVLKDIEIAHKGQKNIPLYVRWDKISGMQFHHEDPHT